MPYETPQRSSHMNTKNVYGYFPNVVDEEVSSDIVENTCFRVFLSSNLMWPIPRL